MAQRVKRRNEKVFNDLQMVNSMINTENVSKTVFNWFNWCQEQNSTRSEPGTFKIWLNCAIVISIFFENIDFLLLFGIQVERQTIRFFCTHSGSATQNFLPIHHFDQSNSHMKIRLENPSASLAKKWESKMKRTKICSWQSQNDS